MKTIICDKCGTFPAFTYKLPTGVWERGPIIDDRKVQSTHSVDLCSECASTLFLKFLEIDYKANSGTSLLLTEIGRQRIFEWFEQALGEARRRSKAVYTTRRSKHD